MPSIWPSAENGSWCYLAWQRQKQKAKSKKQKAKSKKQKAKSKKQKAKSREVKD
ncbi:hypothetical protein [Bordetella bronchiseptica]|uniref:hypothetical protein n=1 Tax=Bordetella bronchiseptica TaxID=518 RepID=UPI001362D030|nr:hypothetical protein [Bordetella bronchiseptica]